MAQNPLIKRYLDAGMAFTQMTQSRAEAIVKDLVKAGEVQAAKTEDLVNQLVERSRRNTDRLLELVRTEVRDQITTLGLVSEDDLATLEKRLGIAPATKVTKKKPAKKKATSKKKASSKKAATKKKATKKKSAAKKKATSKKKASSKKQAATKKAPASRADAMGVSTTASPATAPPATPAPSSPSSPSTPPSGGEGPGTDTSAS